MPWKSDGAGGGSWRPNNPGPWGQGPSGNGPNEFEDWLRRSQERMRRLTPGGLFGGGRGIAAAALAVIVLWLLSGFYTINPNEVGLNKIFGRFTGKAAAGLNYNLPFPIGSVQKLQVTDRNAINIGFFVRQDLRGGGNQMTVDLPEESLMLTADENIADVKFVVIWQIDPQHPEDYAFNVANQRDTVKAVAESAMREVVGRNQIQLILTAGRKTIEPAVQALMQKILNSYHAGVLVLQVQLQSVDPPEQVIAAFRDVTAAQQDQDRLRNEAQGQAARFAKVLDEYKRAPDVTRERIYLETMERVLGAADKVVVDTGSGVVPYLPLPQIGNAPAAPQAGARR